MRPADRLFRIIQLMRRTGRAMTAGEIAGRMEVSARTIYRDMEHLMASGAPIDGERGVGYLLREKFDVPPLTFTFEQIEALAFGIQAVQMLGDSRLGQAAREALEKMEAQLPPDHAARLRTAPLRALRGAAAPLPPDGLGELRMAISALQKISFDYLSLTEQRTHRTVRPVGLCVFGNIWILTGWCELRDDFRDFRVERITSLVRLKEQFEADPARSYEVYISRC